MAGLSVAKAKPSEAVKRQRTATRSNGIAKRSKAAQRNCMEKPRNGKAQPREGEGGGHLKNPCTQGCPERTPECHGTCERYAAFRAAREQVYAERAAKRRAVDARSETFLRWERRKLNAEKRRS